MESFPKPGSENRSNQSEIEKSVFQKEIQEKEKNGKKENVLTPKQEEAKKEMASCLSVGKVYGAVKIRDNFNLPEEIIQSVVKEEMMKLMSEADIYENISTAIEIKNSFNLPEEFVQSAAQEGIRQCFIHVIRGGAIHNAVRIKDNFNLPEEIIQSLAKKETIRRLTKGWPNKAIDIMNSFNLPKEIIQSVEVQSAAKEGMMKYLINGALLSVDDIIKIKDKFNLSEEVAQSTIEKAFLVSLDAGQIASAAKIGVVFDVDIKKPELVDKINNLGPDFYSQFEKTSQQIEAIREEKRKQLENFRAEKRRGVESIIMEFRDPIMDIINQLQTKIDCGEYNLIIGEDVSGRIPTLIIERIIKNIYSEKGYAKPGTLFFAGSGVLDRESEQEKTEKITEILTNYSKKLSQNKDLAVKPNQRALIVTEFIETGRSMIPLARALEKSGIDFDIAALERSNKLHINLPVEIRGKITYNGIVSQPSRIFYNKHLSGTTKKAWEAHSEPLKKVLKEQPNLKNDSKFPKTDPNGVKLAREAARNLADNISRWYKREFMQDSNSSSQ